MCGAWGTTQVREKLPTHGGKYWGIGGVLEWLGVPYIGGYNPGED
jgi:hypothetical protein